MLRIALAQVDITVGDIKGNSRKILAWIRRAEKQDVDMVAFPELALSGYPAEDLLLRKRFLKDCQAAIQAIARKIGHTAAVVGYPRLSGSVHNSAAILLRRRLVGICDKIHLPNYGVFDEPRYFAPGRQGCVLLVGNARVGVSICEDIWVEDVSAAQVQKGRAQVILNISSSPYHAGKGSQREELMRQRAVGQRAFVAYVNLVGGQDELVFDGHSLVIDPAGRVMARGKQFEEDLIVVDIDTDIIKGARPRPVGRARTGLLPVKAVDLKLKPRVRKRKIEPHLTKPMEPLEEIYRAIITGTRDYVRKNGFSRVVVGLSGGIDSSLVAVLAADALGPDGVVGVSMPSRYSTAGSVTDARKVAGNVGIAFMKIGIDGIFDSYLKSLRPAFKGMPPDVSEENIQARIRGNILMALSNKFGWLVLTTGNKSEVAVGYCTLYGDLAGGFAILKDVPKTLVYRLAVYRNAMGRPPIPEEVLEKPPSAELRPDQKDEDTLPPYETLDPVLNMFVVEDLSVREIVGRGFPRKLVQRVARLVDGNEYKRRQGPPGIRITPKAFGKDRRMPITNRYI
jgi:NAD+ synthase (glutamine-hydrolysing)